MNQWHKDIASWRMGKRLYLSVPFTWLLPKARALAKQHNGEVFAGGPAVDLMPGQMADVADIETPCPVLPLWMHNPLATFTTRGCVNKCSFCAVPKIEGDLRELTEWPVRPVVCDNNLLAASRSHFDWVIDRLKAMPYVDFNQGLDARLFKRHHATRIAELRGVKVRFAFDHANMETTVHDAIKLARSEGLKDFGVYVLFGFKDTPDDAIYRLERVRELGIWPNPMRYQPLDALEKNSYIATGWTSSELKRVGRYYSRLRFLEHIRFSDYNPDLQRELFYDTTQG